MCSGMKSSEYMRPVVYNGDPKHYASSLPLMNSLGTTCARSHPYAVGAVNTMQHTFHLRTHYVPTDLLTELSACSTTPKEKRATHSWAIVLHKGPGVCKASLRADGCKPLWLDSPHQQTLNQVERSGHRLRGETRKLRVQIPVSARKRSGYPKAAAWNFTA